VERNKVRTNIYLLPRQVERLEAESEKTGSSVAELIRRAIDAVYADAIAPEPKPLARKERRS
jgi:predicted DNA-binding protein